MPFSDHALAQDVQLVPTLPRPWPGVLRVLSVRMRRAKCQLGLLLAGVSQS